MPSSYKTAIIAITEQSRNPLCPDQWIVKSRLLRWKDAEESKNKNAAISDREIAANICKYTERLYILAKFPKKNMCVRAGEEVKCERGSGS